MTATRCNCCQDDIKAGAPVVLDAIGEVCASCAPDLEDARLVLNSQGMVGIYEGPCPDNDPPKP